MPLAYNSNSQKHPFKNIEEVIKNIASSLERFEFLLCVDVGSSNT